MGRIRWSWSGRGTARRSATGSWLLFLLDDDSDVVEGD